MPQKKNPWVLEHIKSKAAHVEGCYMSALNVMKNVIYSHCEDMCGESANYLFPGIEEFKVMCELMEVSIRGISVKKEHMLEKARCNFCTVTELANYIRIFMLTTSCVTTRSVSAWRMTSLRASWLT